METEGLINGKDGFALVIIIVLTVLGLLIVMILGQAPLIMVMSWALVNVYFFYMCIFIGTKYRLNDDGIYTDSFISRYSKKVNWNEVKKVEETSLAYTNHGRGNCGVYYVIATSDAAERERGLVETMKCNELICIPVTKESRACMVYFAQKYQLNIIRKTKSKGN